MRHARLCHGQGGASRAGHGGCLRPAEGISLKRCRFLLILKNETFQVSATNQGNRRNAEENLPESLRGSSTVTHHHVSPAFIRTCPLETPGPGAGMGRLRGEGLAVDPAVTPALPLTSPRQDTSQTNCFLPLCLPQPTPSGQKGISAPYLGSNQQKKTLPNFSPSSLHKTSKDSRSGYLCLCGLLWEWHQPRCSSSSRAKATPTGYLLFWGGFFRALKLYLQTSLSLWFSRCIPSLKKRGFPFSHYWQKHCRQIVS